MRAPSLKKNSKGKAAKATAKHAAKGTVSKARQEPARAITIAVLAGLILALAGWLLARNGSEDTPPASA